MPDPLFLSNTITIEAWTQRVRLWGSPRKRLRKKLEEEIGTTPDDAGTAFHRLVAECDLNAFDARWASRWWSRTYYILGMPATVLAAIAGATGLLSAAGRVPAAIIALVAAGLTAAATFLGSDEKQRRNIVMSAAWSELADDARFQNLSYIQTMKQPAGSHNEIEAADYYWRIMLQLHRRKGRLLRGEVSSLAESSPASE